MGKSHGGDGIDMFGRDLGCTEVGGVGLRGSSHDDITTMPVNIEFNVNASDQFSDVAWDGNPLLSLGCSCDAGAQFLFGCGILSQEGRRVGFVTFAPFNDLDTLANILN